MRLLLSTPIRFRATPDGVLWARQVPDSYTFWERYLRVFDEVTILARCAEVERAPESGVAASGPGVNFIAVPDYVGPYQLARRYFEVRRKIQAAARDAEAVLMRVPCHVGSLLWRALPPGRPFALEVTADPYDMMGPGANEDALRPLWRQVMTREQKRLCLASAATSYVTREALQRRYPTRPAAHHTYYSDALTTSYSSIALPRDTIAERARSFSAGQRRFRLVTVGAMDRLLKAPDVLLEAVHMVLGRGFDVELALIGDGRKRPLLEGLAAGWGIGAHVRFLGQIADRERLERELDASDLFVLPSRSEALPRALIEAMARGLPSIGSTAGGIPELLAPDCLVPPGNAAALADRICEFLRSPERLERESEANLARAAEYTEEVLSARRLEFYGHLRRETAGWRAGQRQFEPQMDADAHGYGCGQNRNGLAAEERR